MKPVRKGWITWPPVIIVRYWLHQSNTYMNFVELFHRWLLELLVFIPAFFLFNDTSSILMSVIYAFIISHTASAVFNGHIFAMLCHDLFWLSVYKDKRKFYLYVDEMNARLERKAPKYMAGAVFFGSLARGEFRVTSDMDIRFVAKDGFINGVLTAHLVFVERWHSLLSGFPLDIYMFQQEAEIRRKMDVENEHPVSIYNCGEKIRRVLPETRSYSEFKKQYDVVTIDGQ